MIGRRRLCVLASVVLTLLSWEGPAPSQAAGLVGQNEMATASSAWLPVTLTSPLAVNRGGYDQGARGEPGATFELSVDGGEFVAAQLRAVKPGIRGWHPSLVGIRTTGQTDTIATDNILPAGEYQLMLMTDGRNPRMRLEIGGLAGEQVLQPMRALDLLASTAMDSSEAPSRFTAVAGTSVTLTRAGLLHGHVALTSESGPSRAEACTYRSADPGERANTAGCPDGVSNNVVVSEGAIAPGDCCLRFTSFDMEPGPYGMGGNVSSPTAASATAYVSAIPYPEPVSPGTTETPPAKPLVVRDWVTVSGRARRGRRGSVRVRLRCADTTTCAGSLAGKNLSKPARFRIRSQRSAWVTAKLRKARARNLRLVIRGIDSAGRPRTVRAIPRVSP